MEKRPLMAPREEEIDNGIFFAILRKSWWKITLFSIAVGILTLTMMFQFPNIYKAYAVITPVTDDKKQNPALGALASFGIDVGSQSKMEDLESLFNSKDLTVRVFKNHSIWGAIYQDHFDPTTGKRKVGWKERLLLKKERMESPSDWDAIREAKKSLKVSVNRRLGTVLIAFECPNPRDAANIVTYYLEEAKDWLQEKTLERATRNKKFILEQLQKSVDPLDRDRLYTLYGQEVEREMMARNRDQFGFIIVDSPRIPDRKTRPERIWTATFVSALAILVGCIYFVHRGRKG